MQITLGSELPNNRIRLYYEQSPKKPKQTPIYTIEKSKADEFVKKYNSQNSNLNKLGIALTIGGAIGGYRCVGKDKISKILQGMPIGAITGFLTGAAIAHNQKDKLMEKYGVESC